MRRLFPYLLAPLLALASCGSVQKKYDEAGKKIADIADTLEVSAGYSAALEGTAMSVAAKRYQTQAGERNTCSSGNWCNYFFDGVSYQLAFPSKERFAGPLHILGVDHGITLYSKRDLSSSVELQFGGLRFGVAPVRDANSSSESSARLFLIPYFGIGAQGILSDSEPYLGAFAQVRGTVYLDTKNTNQMQDGGVELNIGVKWMFPVDEQKK